MAAAVEVATSAFVIPTRFARSGSILDLHLRAIGTPIVSQHGNSWRLANDIHGLRRDGPKGSDILGLRSRVGIRWPESEPQPEFRQDSFAAVAP